MDKLNERRHKSLTAINDKAIEVIHSKINRYPNKTSLKPYFRWEECCRLSTLPEEEVKLDHGYKVLVPLTLIQMIKSGEIPEESEMTGNLICMFNAYQIFIDTSPASVKWEIEAIFFSGRSILDAYAATGIDEYILRTYEVYFCSVLDWSLQQRLNYASTMCTNEKYDGRAKYVAAQMGYHSYCLFMGDIDLLEVPEIAQAIKRKISCVHTCSLMASIGNGQNDVRTTVSMELLEMKKTLVSHKVGKVDSQVNEETGMSLESANRILEELAKIEDERAIASVGRSAKDAMEDRGKSHLEAVLESMNAPVDIMTDEERAQIYADIEARR